MKIKILTGLLLLPMLLTLGGCAEKSSVTGTPIRVIFDRGHGSMWGVQFYMDVCPEEITSTRYFGEDSADGDQESRENVPITAEQWSKIEAAVAELVPQLEEVDQPSLLKRILGSGTSKLDGGLYRKLTLAYRSGDETVQVEYNWPQSSQADALEQLLEELAASIEN